MKVMFADRCQWRAVYIYDEEAPLLTCGRGDSVKFAHLGIDPKTPSPKVFGSLLGASFSIPLPYLHWWHVEGRGGLVKRIYRAQERFWHALDGRMVSSGERP